MRRTVSTSSLVLVGACVMAAAGPAAADDCPVPAQREPTLRALKAAPDCAESLRLLQSCSWGTGQDVEFSAVVIRRCERVFLSSLSAADRQTYQDEKQRCRTKYAGEHGTQFVSFAAHCEAALAAKYAGGK